MKKFKFLIPVLACFFAVSIAWTTKATKPPSDLVWFEVNATGSATDPMQGARGDQSPFNCPGGSANCARALSIAQGEVSLNSGSLTQYHINSGVNIQTAYDEEELKP